MPDVRPESRLDVGFLTVRVALASAIVFVVLLVLHLFWPVGLLAAIPVAGFLFFYLKWAMQQIGYAESDLKEANTRLKGEDAQDIEVTEIPVVERQTSVIERTQAPQVEMNDDRMKVIGGMLLVVLGGILILIPVWMWFTFGTSGAGVAGWIIWGNLVNSGIVPIVLLAGGSVVIIGMIVAVLGIREAKPKQMSPTPSAKGQTAKANLIRMKTSWKVGLIVVLIIAGLTVGLFYMVTPRNMCSGGQSEIVGLTHYSFPKPQFNPESTLTVSLTNEGTCNENLAASGYNLCWLEGAIEGGCFSLTPAQNSCLNPFVVSPSVTCQLTFSFPTEEYCYNPTQYSGYPCPWEFAFKVRTPTALFEYAVVLGGNT